MSSNRDLFVVAHPEATHAEQHLVGGWYDSELTPRGRGHASAIAERLRMRVEAVDGIRVFSSDLRRCLDTAQVVSDELGGEVHVEPRLREQSYGAAEGLPAGSVPLLLPPRVGDRMRHQDGVKGSETRFDWASRVYEAMAEIFSQPWRETVIVTHGGTLTYVIAAWIGMPIEDAGYVKFKASAGGITHLREDDLFHDHQVVELNNISHLRN